jgi:hypothetical protein
MRPHRALLALVVVLAGAIYALALLLALLLTDSTPERFPHDLAINWTAARGQLAGVSLYDWGGQQRLALAEIGEPTGNYFQSLFTSYISPPTTALLMLPFALLSFPIATGLYRLAIGTAFVLAVGVLAQTLPDEHRLRGWAYGLAGLAALNAVRVSLSLGQVDAWVVLALAVAAYGLHVRRPGLAGAGVAVAALLKVSPGLLLVYLVVRRQWRVALAAVVVGAGLLTIELVAGRPGDLARFGLEVAPAISQARSPGGIRRCPRSRRGWRRARGRARGPSLSKSAWAAGACSAWASPRSA